MPSLLDPGPPPQRTEQQIADSIADLSGRLLRLKEEKKAWNRSMNERIKLLEHEIEGEHEQWEKLKRQ